MKLIDALRSEEGVVVIEQQQQQLQQQQTSSQQRKHQETLKLNYLKQAQIRIEKEMRAAEIARSENEKLTRMEIDATSETASTAAMDSTLDSVVSSASTTIASTTAA